MCSVCAAVSLSPLQIPTREKSPDRHNTHARALHYVCCIARMSVCSVAQEAVPVTRQLCHPRMVVGAHAHTAASHQLNCMCMCAEILQEAAPVARLLRHPQVVVASMGWNVDEQRKMEDALQLTRTDMPG